MATEKFFVFNEDGALKRLKGRIVRFLDNEDPTGSDKSAIRTSLEVSPDAEGLVQADVGTAPNEIPVNGMLGDMAFQSSEGISVGTATIDGDAEIGATSTDHTRLTISSPNNKDGQISFDDTDGSLRGFVVYDHAQEKLKIGSGGANAVYVDSSQRVGIQDANPSPADSLTVTSDNASTSLPLSTMMVRNNSNTTGSCAGIAFQARNSAADVCGAFMGAVSQSTYRTADLAIHTRYNGTYAERLRITNSALVLGSGVGIDFGSTSDGSGSGQAEILNDFETGQWSPQFYSSGGTLTATMDVRSARYVKVGHMVTVMCYIRTSNVDTSSASGSVRISGLPYAVAGSNNYTAVYVGHALNWATAPAGGYTESGSSNIVLDKRVSVGGNLDPLAVSGLTNGSGTNNEIMLTATYCSF